MKIPEALFPITPFSLPYMHYIHIQDSIHRGAPILGYSYIGLVTRLQMHPYLHYRGAPMQGHPYIGSPIYRGSPISEYTYVGAPLYRGLPTKGSSIYYIQVPLCMEPSIHRGQPIYGIPIFRYVHLCRDLYIRRPLCIGVSLCRGTPTYVQAHMAFLYIQLS